MSSSIQHNVDQKNLLQITAPKSEPKYAWHKQQSHELQWQNYKLKKIVCTTYNHEH